MNKVRIGSASGTGLPVQSRKPEVTVYDGTRVSEIAYTCKAAFEQGTLLKVQKTD